MSITTVSYPTITPPKHQRGAATLVISAVLLLVLSLIAAYTSRSSFLNLNVIGAQARLKEAQSNAEAALDCALAQYTANGLLETGSTARTPDQILQQECRDHDLKDLKDLKDLSIEVYYLKTSPEPDGYTQKTLFSQCPASVSASNLKTEGASPGHLYAVGRSSDGTAVYCVGIMVSSQRAIGNGAANMATITAAMALPSKLTGNLTVVNNNPGGVTIWTGTDIGTMTGSFTTQIAIDGTANQTSSGKDGNKFFVGPDVVYNDPQVRNQAIDGSGQLRPFGDFYKNMLGTNLSAVIAGADVRLSPGQILPSASDAYAGKIIYVNAGTGDFDPNMNLGTPSKPVLL
ncbi:MAG: hypothetical protein RQ830_09480, partial [Tepidimonas sp.]|nr:hypothetical protein [Tepidimonas sp.]